MFKLNADLDQVEIIVAENGFIVKVYGTGYEEKKKRVFTKREELIAFLKELFSV